jgi:fluoride exporter
MAIAAVGLGAALGAWLRWAFSAWLNPMVPALPLGTLASNLIGGYLVGVAVAYFAANGSINPEWRLLCITGFLGGLTTFSTFSAESVQLLMAGDYAPAFVHSATHLFGSLVATFLGFLTYRNFA